MIQQIDLKQLSVELRSQLESLRLPQNIDQDSIVFAAFENLTPVGLIFAYLYPFIKEGFISAFFVDPLFRRKGLGTKLMKQLMDYIKKENFKVFEITYENAGETTPYLERILKKTDWAPSKTILRRYFFDKYSFHPEWFFSPLPALPKDCSLFLWEKATQEELKLAENWVKENPLIALYSPFQTKHPIAYANSIGIRFQGNLAGWMIVQRVDPGHLKYSGLFIIPELRGLGPSICLLKEAIRKHTNKEIDTVGILEVNSEVSPAYWIRFIEKRLAPYAFRREAVMSSYWISSRK